MDKCDTDRIANPDNLKFSEGMRTLFIGEDSGNHLNQIRLWAYNVDQKQPKPVRISPAHPSAARTPACTDARRLGAGHAYLMSNVRRPA